MNVTSPLNLLIILNDKFRVGHDTMDILWNGSIDSINSFRLHPPSSLLDRVGSNLPLIRHQKIQ